MAKTTPVKRVTRARAAAKKGDDSLDAPAKKLGTSKVTKPTTTRKTKPAKKDELEEQSVEQPKTTTTRTTSRTTSRTTTTTLSAPARRRIKVTPLDASAHVEDVTSEPPKEATKSKKASTRSKKAAEEDIKLEEPKTVSSSRTRTTKTAEKKAPEKAPAAPKTRGRPKKDADKVEVEAKVQAPVSTTRQTRARSASNAEDTQAPAVVETKSKPTGRKKVTFQDVPEDDKENQPVITRRAATKKDTGAATGIRARPVRKPTTTTKKSTAPAKTKSTKETIRVLTPKKVTQVNRPATPESGGEDELNGAKTPVRDLSQSPKRNPHLASRLSPAKKLDFSQTLAPESPNRKTESATLQSPARRPPSPSKDDVRMSPLKMSPKRVEVPPVFPTTSQHTVNIAASLSPPAQSALLQSPKRVVLDEAAFSQSAFKPKRSPLKASLLQSPARRLFSPAKQKTPNASKGDKENNVNMLGANTPEEVAVSSHFRSSMSPQRSGRVHRMSDDELADELRMEVDFDQSRLELGSPLKVKENPVIPVPRLDASDLPTSGSDIRDEAEQVGEIDLHGKDLEDKTSESGISDPSEVREEVNPNTEAVEDSEAAEQETAPIPTTVSGSEMELHQSRSAPSLSQILFRSDRFRDSDESSEDELAADMTPDRAPRPFRSSLTGVNARSRLSQGVETERNVGFTPLAAQMSGWFAASPNKKSQQKSPVRGLFSPVAAQHVDGEVVISRQSTPQQKGSPASKRTTSSRKSFAPRVSMAPTLAGSPEKTSFFDEQMMGVDMEDPSAEEADEQRHAMLPEVERLAMVEAEEQQRVEQDEGEEDEDTVIINQPAGELTTDLINFTHASDTAMADFANLASEAEEMADTPDDDQRAGSESVYGDENQAPAENPLTETNLPAAEQEDPIEAASGLENGVHVTVQEVSEDDADIVWDNVPEDVTGLVRATPARAQILVQDEAEYIVDNMPDDVTGLVRINEPAVALPASVAHVESDIITPVRPDLNVARYANTVVSKVPLRPEGDVSPIKVMKKRSRSLSMAKEQSPPKRPQLTPVGKLAARSVSENALSPDRRIRSAAPSPAHTTPGQMSFAVEDFGDSTLDGLELPDDEMDFDVGPPSTIKSRKGVQSSAPTPSRTPLKAVGGGILSGAVVYVEVHTTEGADASGVYVDLLTQMGAKCVRDWRWNPRASVADAEDAQTPGKVGITHVVYKDGGKRTLEKVRDAKGEVWCVGVRWVLDCERENKWLDESSYIVDHAILPRGGSRRRKSMEPRALINANGSLSASRASRRSTSAEFTNQMREDLINTPVRGLIDREANNRDSLASAEDTEISSTYNSPTTTMNVRNPGISTPTELVDWDPATAMTPAPTTVERQPMDTPYLMKQGARAMNEGVMKSAPPKQANKGLFENVEKKDDKLKLKLQEARRKTMGWRPTVGSPLGKF